ncbi:ADP-ribosylglycohydrolase family protein [Lysobacter korlensis]|uniref:ADP-ribosylglycohydrolase family protein n=1 Tax=Lysobacter korlensis TaxID=553636 RepID=A0ABV6RXX0_9GAMM
MDRTVDRALGALYGVALGDAMGMPSEGKSRDAVRTEFGWLDRLLPGPDREFVPGGLPRGAVTDDTQQTVLVAEGILEAGGRIDARILARRIVAWADALGDTAGSFLGPSSARAIDALRDGVPPEESGRLGTTNGGAMRIVPVGISSPSGDLPALVDRVEQACLATHHTDVAISGAALIAGAVSAALDTPAGIQGGERLDMVIATALECAELGGARGNRVASASVVERAAVAVGFARSAGTDERFLQRVYDVVGTSVLTPESVPAALGVVVRAHGDPVRAAVLAANLGGDTDTIGAMAAGICGALTGAAGVPAGMRATLDQVNSLDLGPLAEALVGYRTGGPLRARPPGP